MRTVISIAQHARAARNRGAIAACFAYDRRRLAGDSGLIHGGHAFYHFTIARNHLARGDTHQISCAQSGARNLLDAAGSYTVGGRLRFGLAQRIGLCLASTFSHSFSEVCEKHRNQSHSVICRSKPSLPR